MIGGLQNVDEPREIVQECSIWTIQRLKATQRTPLENITSMPLTELWRVDVLDVAQHPNCLGARAALLFNIDH